MLVSRAGGRGRRQPSLTRAPSEGRRGGGRRRQASAIGRVQPPPWLRCPHRTCTGACIHAGGSTMGFCDTYAVTQWRCVIEAITITSTLVDLSNHSQISPPTWFHPRTSTRATRQENAPHRSHKGARGALVSSLSRPWALWKGVSTNDVQKGRWITKLNNVNTQ